MVPQRMKDTADRRKNVGVWLRVSTEDQVRGESLEVHEKRARMYVEARDWNVVTVYRMDGVSGKSILSHPQAQRMLSDVRLGRITGLVFSKLARLARNTKELIEISEEFREHDADLISLQESVDTGSPAGRFFFTVIGAMAQWEREEISARVAAAVPIRARMGKPTGGQSPFGYRWVGKRLVLDHNEAAVVRLLFELFLEHKRRRTTAKVLNDRGYRTRNGSRWSDTTITRIIENPTYKGLHRANYTRTDDRRKSWQLKPESEWVHTEVEPAVDKETWDACNCFLAGHRTPRKRITRRPMHLFAGVTYCACGKKMYVWSNSPKYVCTKCKNRIAIADLEAVYREQLTQYLVSPDAIEEHFASANDTVREKTRLVTAAEEELRRIETEDERGYRLYIDGQLTAEEFGRRHKPLSERKTQLEDELPRLQAEIDVLRISNLSSMDAIAEGKSLAQHWPDMSNDEKRQIVEAITERIVVKDNEIEIDLLYDPPAPPLDRSDSATHRQGFIAATS